MSTRVVTTFSACVCFKLLQLSSSSKIIIDWQCMDRLTGNCRTQSLSTLDYVWLNIILFLYELLLHGFDINYHYFIITSYFNVMPTTETHDTVTSTCQHHTSTLLLDSVTSLIHHRHLTTTDPNIFHHARMKKFYRSWASVILFMVLLAPNLQTHRCHGQWHWSPYLFPADHFFKGDTN